MDENVNNPIRWSIIVTTRRTLPKAGVYTKHGRNTEILKTAKHFAGGCKLSIKRQSFKTS